VSPTGPLADAAVGRHPPDDATPGYVHVYTGDGRGKTTAAFGLALRAAGHGKRVFVGQIMKGQPGGEVGPLAESLLVDVEQFGMPGCVYANEVGEQVERAREGLERARCALRDGAYDVAILDEIDIAIDLGPLTVADTLRMLHERPRQVELVRTGRRAPREIVEHALLTHGAQRTHVAARAGSGARTIAGRWAALRRRQPGRGCAAQSMKPRRRCDSR
jgi:cob(I)alamin adenosyltransferase